MVNPRQLRAIVDGAATVDRSGSRGGGATVDRGTIPAGERPRTLPAGERPPALPAARRPAPIGGSPGSGRLIGSRPRRHRVVSALTVLACLMGLGAYLGTGRTADDPRPGRAPHPVGLPTTDFTSVPADPRTDRPSPGFRQRERSPVARPAATTTARPAASPSTTVAKPPPASPYLTVTRHDVPDVVDLTSGGSRDWAHWGLRGGDSVVRKRNGTGEIVDQGGPGVRGSYDSNPESFSWSDGAPVASAHATPTGVYTCGRGNGFALAVAGSGELRTVQLYAGLWIARGRLDVRLSNGGPTTTLRMEDRSTNRTARFEIRFRAARDAHLAITWTTEIDYHGGCGNVDLQAMTVS
ncbi:hypothetical protein ACPFP2_06930 [Micromonospora citrea]|uniref:hypothetical protein n=1 Tax=Micromonospora citrea TaxID=47855 RepID=UPI003C3C889D